MPDDETTRRSWPTRGGRLPTIVAAASRLFHERGYDSTSISDLAATLDMSVGGLYRYISTKADLLVRVCDDIYGDLPETLTAIAAPEAEPTLRLRVVVEHYFRSCLAHAPLILLMYREYRHLPPEARRTFQAREEAIAQLIEQQIAAVLSSSPDPSPVDPWWLAHDIVLMGHLPALKSWAVREQRPTDDQLVAHQAGIVIAALER